MTTFIGQQITMGALVDRLGADARRLTRDEPTAFRLAAARLGRFLIASGQRANAWRLVAADIAHRAERRAHRHAG